jgi:hypothetical protein
MTRIAIKLVLIAASLSLGAVAQAVDINVSKTGSPAPARGGTAYRMVESAVSQAQANDTIVIAAGQYREALTIDPGSDGPVTLTATGGDAVIGDFTNAGQTTLRVLSYNTHLFGSDDLGPLDLVPDWQDAQRAPQIGLRVREEAPDVALLQEVWDEDLAAAILVAAGPPYNSPGHFKHGDRKDGVADFLLKNSGLLTMSRTPLMDVLQIDYENEEDTTACDVALVALVACAALLPPASDICAAPALITAGLACEPVIEAFSSKGYIRARVEKDGFSFIIYNTHAQAFYNDEQKTVRGQQMAELSLNMSGFHSSYPDHAIIAGGDYNIFGDDRYASTTNSDGEDMTAEYSNALIAFVGIVGNGHDAVRNAPFFDKNDRDNIWTVITREGSPTNTLNDYFEDDTDCQPGGTNCEALQGRLDFVLFNGDQGTALDILPKAAVLKKLVTSPPITGDGTFDNHTDSNLSDHYGVEITFDVYRN